MGRPLKTQRYNTSLSTPIDQALPPFSALTDPVTPIGSGVTPPWVGVVGGTRSPATTPTYPVVAVTINIQLPSGAAAGVSPGVIVRQKGARKYLVAKTVATTAGSFVVGASYIIASLGTTTDWSAAGAGVTFAVGDTFTAKTVGAGNGTAYLIGTCVLDDTPTPAVGCMSIGFLDNTSTMQYISKLTNRFLFDFAGGEVGGNSNSGNVWDWEQVQNNDRWDANFFTDHGYEIKSGTTGAANTGTQQNQVPMGLVDNYTS